MESPCWNWFRWGECRLCLRGVGLALFLRMDMRENLRDYLVRAVRKILSFEATVSLIWLVRYGYKLRYGELDLSAFNCNASRDVFWKH